MRREMRVLLLLSCCAAGLASPARTSSQVLAPKPVPARAGNVSAAERSVGVVLVAGASGQTGREIVRQLRDQGYTVRAMARSAERLAGLGPDVQPVVADVTDPAPLVRALSRVNVVISAIGGRWPIGENGFESVDYRGNRALIDAARHAGVGRFMLVSAGSAGRKGFLYELSIAPSPWKARAEDHLRGSGLDYSIVAAGGLEDGPGGRSGIRVARRPDYVVDQIDRADVARVIVACTTDQSCSRNTVTVVNDPALPPDAWRARLAALPRD